MTIRLYLILMVAAGLAVGGAYVKGRADGRKIERAAQLSRDIGALDAANRAARDRALRDLAPGGLSEPDPYRRD